MLGLMYFEVRCISNPPENWQVRVEQNKQTKKNLWHK